MVLGQLASFWGLTQKGPDHERDQACLERRAGGELRDSPRPRRVAEEKARAFHHQHTGDEKARPGQAASTNLRREEEDAQRKQGEQREPEGVKE